MIPQPRATPTGRTTAAVTTASRPGSGEELTINAKPAITADTTTPMPTAGPHKPIPRRPFFVAPHAVRPLLLVMAIPSGHGRPRAVPVPFTVCKTHFTVKDI
ncbi:hypothetical protein GCM10027031_22740 [Corynebacterium atrinae]